ncbi:MAG: hypothetical protein AAF919_02235 [Pseudomonadota bacterium]
MPFTILSGRFAPNLGVPDGDSVRFVPDNPDCLFALPRRGRPPKLNPNNGSITLRFEGIDTPETGAALPWSENATTAMLAFLALDAADTAPGWIATAQLGPNGRPIAFVFPGAAPEADGADIWLGPEEIKTSVNWAQLAAGLAYPLFYDTLFDDLRGAMAEAAIQARQAGNGLWPEDVTGAGARWTGDPDTLPVLFPKLWRRIDAYVRDETFFDPAAPFKAFTDWIAFEKPERVSVPSQALFTGFDNVIDVTDDTVRMNVDPTDLVIISRPDPAAIIGT